MHIANVNDTTAIGGWSYTHTALLDGGVMFATSDLVAAEWNRRA